MLSAGHRKEVAVAEISCCLLKLKGNEELMDFLSFRKWWLMVS